MTGGAEAHPRGLRPSAWRAPNPALILFEVTIELDQSVSPLWHGHAFANGSYHFGGRRARAQAQPKHRTAGDQADQARDGRCREHRGLGMRHSQGMSVLARRRPWRASRRVALVSGVLAAGLVMRAGAEAKQACVRRTFEGSTFTVCTFEARGSELRLAPWTRTGKPLRGFAALASELGDDARRVEFAMNAGMFDADGAPIGLLVAGGIALHAVNTDDGSGNFYLKPNGVLSVDRDGGVRVESTAAYATRRSESTWATQSGPMLVVDGALHPAITHDGVSRTIRNGVGTRDSHAAVFVISEAPVSFGRLARLFRDELHCENALYLDGAVSSAWIPSAGRRDSSHALGPMVVVLARQGAGTSDD